MRKKFNFFNTIKMSLQSNALRAMQSLRACVLYRRSNPERLLKKCIEYIFAAFLLLTTIFCYATEIESHTFSTTEEQTRYTTLIQETRCIVCQNQSLADSSAPLAIDLRDKIYHLILDKKSDMEIKDYLVQRYGEFILLRPRFNKLTLFLWLFPILGFCFITIMLNRLVKPSTVTADQ